MMLEASRQHIQALRNTRNVSHNASVAKETREPYNHCGSTTHFTHKCYIGNPKTTPEWFKLKIKEHAKGKGKAVEQAREFQTKMALHDREDDFTDNNGVHFSA